MFFIVKILAKTAAALNSNSKPASIAAAVSCAFLLALIPAANLLWISIVLLTLLLRLNWGMELLFWVIFKGVSLLLTPWIEPLGWKLMQNPVVMNSIYRLNDLPLLPFFGLNNSLMIGGLAAGLIFWIPLFILARLGIILFREKLSPAIARSKWMKAFQKSPLVSTFTKAMRQFAGLYR